MQFRIVSFKRIPNAIIQLHHSLCRQKKQPQKHSSEAWGNYAPPSTFFENHTRPSKRGPWMIHEPRRLQLRKPNPRLYVSPPRNYDFAVFFLLFNRLFIKFLYNTYVLENASVVEWSITTDCKSVASGLRRFESFPTHKTKKTT